jgi:hypothetical protein
LGKQQPRPPANLKAEEFSAWNNRPEVKAARDNYRYYAVSFKEDGSFRIEDVPPGQYELRMMFNEPSASGSPNMGRVIGNLNKDVEVPENGAIDEPVDLGKLELQVRKN